MSFTAIRPLHDGAACRSTIRSVQQDVRSKAHARSFPEETIVISNLRFLLLSLPLLLWDFVQFLLLILVLSPGFMRQIYYYTQVSGRQSVRYASESCRQTLDVYASNIPNNNNNNSSSSSSSNSVKKRPVVFFVPGGAWMISYKLWGALLSRSLNAVGIVVVMPDYRNYPVGTVAEQIEDMELALQWTLDHIHNYNGDPKNVVIAGESAGGHIAWMALVRKALSERLHQKQSHASLSITPWMELLVPESSVETTFRATDFKGFLSVAAPYNLESMDATFAKHGIGPRFIESIFGGKKDQFNPIRIVKDCNDQEVESLKGRLPPMRLFHGSHDQTVPFSGSLVFLNEFKKTGATVDFVAYEGWNHTRANVDGPLDGDHRFHKDVLDAVKEWTDYKQLVWMEDDHPLRQPVLPALQVKLGVMFMPF